MVQGFVITDVTTDCFSNGSKIGNVINCCFGNFIGCIFFFFFQKYVVSCVLLFAVNFIIHLFSNYSLFVIILLVLDYVMFR